MFEIKNISLESLNDVVHVMNDSSRGLLFEFNLNVVGFLSLSHFWNFSYKHSYIGYVDRKPAGVILNSVDPAERECYSFYWGVVPEFRRRRSSMDLLLGYLRQVRREGYRATYGDTNHDSPSSIYWKLGYRPFKNLVQMESGEPILAAAQPMFEICPLTLEELFAQRPSNPGGVSLYWVHRPTFLHHAAALLEVLGACRNERLEAYAVLTTWPGQTNVIDFHCPEPVAGAALLRYVVTKNYPRPYIFSFVYDPSPASDVLVAAGFALTKRFTAMSLDLAAPSGQVLPISAGFPSFSSR